MNSTRLIKGWIEPRCSLGVPPKFWMTLENTPQGPRQRKLFDKTIYPFFLTIPFLVIITLFRYTKSHIYIYI